MQQLAAQEQATAALRKTLEAVKGILSECGVQGV
jgi:hypothetical protein